MSLINTVIGIPLGWIMYFCYRVVNHYGLAILLFTLLSKLLLLPLSIVVQKNSIKMIRIQPELNRISTEHFGDRDTIADKSMLLYKREKYSPLLGIVPMLIQILLVLGLIQVIYNPMQYLLHVDPAVCQQIVSAFAAHMELPHLGGGVQLQVMEAMQDPAHYDFFMNLAAQLPEADIPGILKAAGSVNTMFLGINLAKVPHFLPLDRIVLIPVVSFLTTFLMCWAQNRDNVLQKEQGVWSRWGTAIFTIAVSTWFTCLVPAGVGLYWSVGNLLAIGNLYLMNGIYQPKKYIDYKALEETSRALQSQKEAAKARKKKLSPYRKKERADYRRFLKSEEPKQLVFYSESSGFYKYFKGMIEYILEHSHIVIHYITSDPEDAIFQMNEPRIVPYYIGDLRLIPLMMKMDADMVVMTIPDLELFHIKRSLVRKDVEYVYADHAVDSGNLTCRTHAFDHFDTLFCVGPHQVEEARAIEALYDLKPRRLVQVGYGLLDEMTAAWEAHPKAPREKKTILIAPSWQTDNIMDSCLDELITQLLPLRAKLIIRPHPQYVRLYPGRIRELEARYQGQWNEDFVLQTDFSSTETVYTSDLLISDWSNVAYEFAFSTFKPVLYINTPMKILNPEHDRIDIVPFDIRIRSQLGAELELDELDRAPEIARKLLASPDEYRSIIQSVKEREFYNIGHGAEAAGRYIVRRLQHKAALKQQTGGDGEK